MQLVSFLTTEQLVIFLYKSWQKRLVPFSSKSFSENMFFYLREIPKQGFSKLRVLSMAWPF